jgi:NAD-dependent deacetylase
MVPIAASHGAPVVILNAEPTAMDDLADVIIRGSISEALPAIVADLSPVG